MVLISIDPFASRKLLLAIVAFLCFSAFCFADPVLMVHRYTARPEQMAATKTAPRLTLADDAWGAATTFGALRSGDSCANQLRFTAPGQIGHLTVPSSAFHELRFSNFQAALSIETDCSCRMKN
jgi:hypothetical protein